MYAYLKISAIGAEDNYFNVNLRYKLARYAFLREVLGLHYDGDGKYDYLGQKTKEIKIQVISMENVVLNSEILEDLSEKIQKITGKPTSYFFSSLQMPAESFFDLQGLKSESDKRHVFQRSSGRAVLYVIAANQLKNESSRLGSTLEEDGIVIFSQTLKGYTGSEEADVFNRFASGVLLHEFGHQIGLAHNDFQGCLMNESSEFKSSNTIQEIIDDFCESERKEIKEVKY